MSSFNPSTERTIALIRLKRTTEELGLARTGLESLQKQYSSERSRADENEKTANQLKADSARQSGAIEELMKERLRLSRQLEDALNDNKRFFEIIHHKTSPPVPVSRNLPETTTRARPVLEQSPAPAQRAKEVPQICVFTPSHVTSNNSRTGSRDKMLVRSATSATAPTIGRIGAEPQNGRFNRKCDDFNAKLAEVRGRVVGLRRGKE